GNGHYSSQKAGIWIFIHLFDKGLQFINLRQRLIAMPLLITFLPVDFPYPLAANPGCFGHLVPYLFFRILPVRACFKYNEALIINGIIQIKLRSEMFWRTRAVNKRSDDRLPFFEF